MKNLEFLRRSTKWYDVKTVTMIEAYLNGYEILVISGPAHETKNPARRDGLWPVAYVPIFEGDQFPFAVPGGDGMRYHGGQLMAMPVAAMDSPEWNHDAPAVAS